MISASSAVPIFLDELRLAKRSPNTVRTYEQGLRAFLRVIKGDDLSEENFKLFLHKTQGPKQITYREAVSRLYQYHAPGIPVKLLIERYGIQRGRRLPAFKESMEDDLEKLFSYAETLRGDLLALRDRAFIITLADTGLRISEACSLTRGDIDFKRRRAIVIGKGDNQGVVRFSKRSIRAIQDYLTARTPDLDGKSGKPLGSLPVFARHDRGAGKKTVKPIEAEGMRVAFVARMKEAGIEEGAISPHKFRHLFVTLILRSPSGGLFKASQYARHSDINLIKRYGHLTDEDLDRSFDEIIEAE
jgi:integrase